MNATASAPEGALFLADNLALDFINTAYGVGEQHRDCLTDDASVLDWLRAAGQVADDFHEPAPPGLLELARQLRDSARSIVSGAMAGMPADTRVIDGLLEAGRPLTALQWNADVQGFQLVTRRRDGSPASLLEPVASALVSLVTHDRFEYVRQCEAHDCVLLFHDLTKSHRRRWCSMATCGNRMKVAAFRSRKKS